MYSKGSFLGSISVNSEPSGASVYLDGANKGTTPATISGVSAGAHEIKIIKKGYKEWSKSISVAGGSTSDISVSLSEVPTSTPPAPTPPVINLNPALFVIKGEEFFLDTRYGAILGLPIKNGVDLSNYDLEFVFQGGDGRQVQLWYKDSGWRNVYSFPYTIQSGQSIRYNPFTDGRNVDQFNDFTHIYAIGANVFGGVESIQITSAKLIKRD